ncbi:MAG: UDP-N-acetylmuramoyl-tripeptide--D-alanyl-D-alanine ligase [Clostridia bacterium]|nr:UDP-N-acetylmuramoyl-tripeptide--D-alanyl-D-alanine ligase [Clostridia bacterium]MBR5768004.1 UDP-N-acetylmuramoyl-tripeptide--D-alanyl-D-alanine ligase [Clostridia bacterium]
MRDLLSSGFVAEATGGEIVFPGEKNARGVSVDSREINGTNGEGPLFAAIKGERTDGNLYVRKAVENGCAGVLFDGRADFPADMGGAFAVRAEDTTRALGSLAGEYIKRFDVPRVCVTGSVGKTTTRGMISAVTSRKFRTHSTSGNFNNELGLPLTVLNMRDDAEAGVFELGMGQKGDISYLSRIVKPTVGVITSIGTAHIEFLGSREAIRDAKMEIRDGMPEGASLILNGDEPLLSGISGAVFCSTEDRFCDWYAGNVSYSDSGMTFDVYKNGDIRFEKALVPAFGNHIVLDALLAWAAGSALGVADAEIARGLASFENVGQRQKIERHGAVTLIIDCYNASAESVLASEKVGRRLAGDGRFITVFGDVLELGEHSERIHREIGTFSAGLCDALVTYGPDARFAAEAARCSGLTDVVQFGTESGAGEIADSVVSLTDSRKNNVILFKASHGMNLGVIADAVRERLSGI